MIELDLQLIKNKVPGEKAAISGNAAVARALIESSVKIITSYPGTPCAETIEHLARMCDDYNFYIEWSINEKVALEIAAAAAMSGLRSAFLTKHVGMNVAFDSLIHICYAGLNAGMVIISADDPGAFDSPIEEDSRFFARMSEILGLEASNQQEAKDMVVNALEISEKVKLPVFIRLTNRVLYGRGSVVMGKLQNREYSAQFEKEKSRWFIAGRNAVKRHQWLHDQQAHLRDIVEHSIFNNIHWANQKKYGIIAIGVAYSYAKEALRILSLDDKVSILKLGYFNPLPENLIKIFLKEIDEILIIEELEPIIEEKIKIVASEIDKKVKIYGKLTCHLPETDALNTELIRDVIISLWLNKTDMGSIAYEIQQQAEELNKLIPKQDNSFCPGCPHRASYFVLKESLKIANQEFIFINDIGCYMLGVKKPFSFADAVFCMGASIGIGSGLYHAKIKQRIIAIIGDSTFLHAGIPPLINCCYTNTDILIYILDNRTIAMTGLQPHPGIGVDAKGNEAKPIKIEDIVKACNVDYLAIIDPFEVNKAEKILARALKMEGQRVVISRKECAQVLRKINKENKKIKTYKIEFQKCKKCKLCILSIGCPAILIRDNCVVINKYSCSGCGLCCQVCPYGAIILDREK